MRFPLLSLCILLSAACADSGPAQGQDLDEDGYTDTDGDCADQDPLIHPGATELCDGIDNDCNGSPDRAGETTDADQDGVLACMDCDDADPAFGSLVGDRDCDGIPTLDDCNDLDAAVGPTADDYDCDGLATGDDCDDQDPKAPSRLDDGDCDGVPTKEDCDDGDTGLRSVAFDNDCDGSRYDNDCDDNDPALGPQSRDVDCDGYYFTVDCDDNDPDVHPGLATAEPDVCGWDADGDGWATTTPEPPWDPGTDCDDNANHIYPGVAPMDPGVCGIDVDGDGWADARPPEPVQPGSDCEDDDEDVHPGAAEPSDAPWEDSACDGHYVTPDEADLTISSTYPDGTLGIPQVVGDVDGDGRDDMIIEWTLDANLAPDPTYSLVFGADLTTTVAVQDAAISFAPELGSPLAHGDFDGDGLADIWFRHLPDDPTTEPVDLYLLYGASLTTPGQRTLADVGLAMTDDYVEEVGYSPSLGTALAAIPDLDGDGKDEIAVSNSELADQPGRVYVVFSSSFHGQASFDLNQADVIITGAIYQWSPGDTLAAADDIDGDGLADLVVGTEWDNSLGPIGAGSVRVFSGTTLLTHSDLWLSDADHAVYSDSNFAFLGYEIAVLDDLDGDGLADLALGSRWGPVLSSGWGRAYIYLAADLVAQGYTPLPVHQEAHITLEGSTDSPLGNVLLPADLDGDGSPNLVAYSPIYTIPITNSDAFAVLEDHDLTDAYAGVVGSYRFGFDGFGYLGLAIGDFDGDGDDDVIGHEAAPNLTTGDRLHLFWSDR